MKTGRNRYLLLAVALIAVVAVATADAAWTRLADVSGATSTKKVKGGGGITTIRDTIYLLVGNNTLDVMKYSIDGNNWTALAQGVPVGPKNKKVKKGAYIVDDRENLYVFKGGGTNEFYSYSPATGVWADLPDPVFTKGIKGGFALYQRHSGVGYIYVGSGSNLPEWKRYNIDAGTWEALAPPLPAEKVKLGSALADFDGLLYFLLGNTKEVNFYGIDLEAPVPAWAPQPVLPLLSPLGKNKKVKEGGCLQEVRDVLYAAKGGSTREIWAFDTNHVWSFVGQVGDGLASKGIKCGKSLTDGDDGLFVLIGNNTNEFWRYDPPLLDAAAPDPGVAGSPSPRPGLDLTAFPNPARSHSSIRCNVPAGTRAELAVHDATGRLVHTAVSTSGSFGTVSLPAGAYILRARSGAVLGQTELVVTE